jgi:YHS domain-containing protein
MQNAYSRTAALSLPFVIFLLACYLPACHGRQPAGQDAVPIQPSADAAPAKKLDLTMVDYPKDPTCGMPLTAGLEDTLHYKGKVYGFCSRECKEAFVKGGYQPLK